MKSKSAGITPALRFNALTPLYDLVVRYTTRERKFKTTLLERASIRCGESVLDVGCGTGTLLQAIAAREPGARLAGVDADPGVLRIAHRKLRASGSRCKLIPGYSTAMDVEDSSFDHVFSTLFFHHLLPSDKQATIGEMYRVLRPGGSVHVADWGRPTGAIQRLAFYQIQLLDGFETTREHTSDELAARFCDGGFEDVEGFGYLRTMFGTLRFIRAIKD